MSRVSPSPPAPRAGWIGPVFGWELLRLGRRGAAFWLRVLMASMLLAALWGVYLSEFPRDAGQLSNAQFATAMSAFTGTFALVFLMAQLVAVTLLAPLYVVGAMGEERDRKTLEFLLATDLTNWEIIAGKVGSRMLQLVGLLLTGLPIIALMQIWGGVEPLLLLTGYGITLVALLSVSGVSVACAAVPGSLRASAVRSFLAVGLIAVLNWDLSPFAALIRSFRAGAQGVDAAALLSAWEFLKWQLLWGVTGILVAVYCLRRLAFRQTGRPNRPTRRASVAPPLPPQARTQGTITGGWESPEFAAAAGQPREPRRHWADPPPIGDSPLYWKEVYFSGSMNKFARLMSLMPTWLWLLIGMVLAVMMFTADVTPNYAHSSNVYARVMTSGFLFMICLTAGLAAAGSVSRERQNLTMIDLLMIPESRHRFLIAKWRAAMKRGFGLFCGLVAILAGAVVVGLAMSGGIALGGALLMVLATLVYAGFSASLGLYLSVRCASVLRASCLWLVAVLLILIGGLVLVESATTRPPANPFTRSVVMRPDWDCVIHPAYTWRVIGYPSRDRDYYSSWEYRESDSGASNPTTRLLMSILGLFVYASLGWLFYWLALARFETEGQV